MIVLRIKQSKRPNSSVPGDIPPRLVMRVVNNIAPVLASVYNSVSATGLWPKLWKMEYQTIIPKKGSPSGFEETRNLSCTNFFSKILESFVLDSIASEITISEEQFGGQRGCGTDHFLIETWNNILETLEDPKKVMSLMSVDFSKAFNRLSHVGCLKKLEEKSASNQSLKMVYAFLSERRMRVRSGVIMSSPRHVHGGSPQGTRLGNVLFCIAVDKIAAGYQNVGEVSDELQINVSPLRAIPVEYRPVTASTPIPAFNDSIEYNPFGMRKKLNTIDDTIETSQLGSFEVNNTWVASYIDDLNVGEELDIDSGTSTFSTRKEQRLIKAKNSEEIYNNIEVNGSEVGMIINSKKTQLLCISDSIHYDIVCYINAADSRIQSGETLKILGFVFGVRPSVSYQIESLLRKFSRLTWSINHLKRARLSDSVIIKAYISMIRPVLEFSSNVYGPMLSVNQSEAIERCQRLVLKIVYGFDVTYAEALSKSGLKMLSQRRKEMFDSFCQKTSQSTRFSSAWLPKKEQSEMGLRNKKKYIEFHSRTDRLYKSPLYEMRRNLNKNQSD